jgi:hypothetical protein
LEFAPLAPIVTKNGANFDPSHGNPSHGDANGANGPDHRQWIQPIAVIVIGAIKMAIGWLLVRIANESPR